MTDTLYCCISLFSYSYLNDISKNAISHINLCIAVQAIIVLTCYYCCIEAYL